MFLTPTSSAGIQTQARIPESPGRRWLMKPQGWGVKKLKWVSMSRKAMDVGWLEAGADLSTGTAQS